MSKFKVRRSVPTVRLTGTQSLVTSGVNYVSTNPPQWITTPAPVFHEGYPNQQFDLGAYIYNYNQTTDSFSLAPGSVQLPSWLTFSGTNSRYLTANGTQVDASDFTGLVIRVTRAGLFSNSQPISVSVTDAVAFTLTSQLGGSDLPWAFGHAFRQGDISTGQSVVVSGANSYQCSIKTTWPDGSAKFAVLSGKADFTAGVAKVLSLVSGTASSGTTLTTTHLQATGITAEFDAGAYGTATFSNADFSSFAYLWVSGHVMSSWTFRKVFSGDSDLVAWMEVRLYQGGAVEVLPWVELGFLTGSTVSNKSATYTFTLGGTSRFSSSIDVKHHTRIPLVTGSTFAYWLGTDPQITPKHDRAYLMSTKLVPNYGWTSPSESTLDGLQQTYTPNTLGGVVDPMSNPGQSTAILSNAQAFYVTSNGDLRAYKAAIVYGLAGGSWHTHYRDATTHEVPKFSSYASLSSGGAQAGTGGTNGSFGTNPTTHQPSFGYLPFLITGKWWFWEESALWTFFNYLWSDSTRRRGEAAFGGPYYFASGSAAVADTRQGAYANRGAHWSLCKLAQTLALCPSSHGTFTEWKSAWENNAEFYKAVYVDGTFASGNVNPQGSLGTYADYGYTSTDVWGEGWESTFGVQVWGFASELGLPVSSAATSNTIAVRNHAYKQVTVRSGDGSEYNWRRFTVYSYPLSDKPFTHWYTPTESYTRYLAGHGLSSIPATEGLSLKAHSSDTDMVVGDSSYSDYFPFGLSALAYAVDHGAAGANDGWLRITGASNYAAISVTFNNNPDHGIVPRNPPSSLPAWVSALPLWQWYQIPNTNLSSRPPSVTGGLGNPVNKIVAWCGAALKRSGSVYIIGMSGGHADYAGNEINALTLNTPTPGWIEVSPPRAIGTVYSNSPFYADLSGASSHSYYRSQYIDAIDRFVQFGNKGCDNPPTWPNPPVGWTYTGTETYCPSFNWSTQTWDTPTYIPAMPSGGSSIANLCCKHPTTGDVYVSKGTTGSSGWLKWTRSTNTWAQLSSVTESNYCGSAIDPTRDLMLICGDSSGTFGPRVRNLSGTAQSVTFGGLGGNVLRHGGYMGVIYDETNDVYLVFLNTNPMTMYRVRASDWFVDQPTTTGTAPAARQNGIHNAVQYVPELRGFVYANSYTGNVYFMRTAA